jgi:membrane protease YdiL (CAAX protease family)
MFYFGYLYTINAINMPAAEAYSSIALSLFFPAIVFSYLYYRGNNTKAIIQQLGLSRDKISLKIIAIGVLLFVVILLFEAGLAAFSYATNIQLPTNVQQLLTGTPFYFLVFTFLIAPIDEEILFRGFLVPRLGGIFKSAWAGIIVSAIIFAILHLSYLSVSEFAAAFLFGLLAGYAFYKTKSLYPSILAHMFVNFLTIASLITLGMLIHP